MWAGVAPRSDVERLPMVRHSSPAARIVVGRTGGYSPSIARRGMAAVGAAGARAPSRRQPFGEARAMDRGFPIRPVLKHGPRSLTCVRVDGCGYPVGAKKLMSGKAAPRCAAAPPADA